MPSAGFFCCLRERMSFLLSAETLSSRGSDWKEFIWDLNYNLLKLPPTGASPQ